MDSFASAIREESSSTRALSRSAGGSSCPQSPAIRVPKVPVGQAGVVVAAVCPHCLVDECCEASRFVSEHAGDDGGIGVRVNEDSPDIEKHGARTAWGVHAFRSF